MSREQVVRAAVVLLDEGGDTALTFRALARSLSTGNGAVLHYVSSKGELLDSAAEHVVQGAVSGASTATTPHAGISLLARRLFDALRDRPWLGVQLARDPLQPAMLTVLEHFGRQIRELGLAQSRTFYVTSAFVSYVLGASAQNVANAQLVDADADRSALLEDIAARWARLDEGSFPFLRGMAAGLPQHDDRHQFLAGLDLLLAGLALEP